MNTLEIYNLLTSSPIDKAKADEALSATFAGVSDLKLIQEIRRRRLLEVCSVDTIKQMLAYIQ